MKQLFEWKSEYATGIGEIDEQHKKIFTIINNLFNALHENRGTEVTDEVLKELAAYADYHFACEERYFRQYSFEGTEAHMAEHDAYRARVDELMQQKTKDDITKPFEILDFLEDWWISHITGSDQKYIECFRAHGLTS